MSGLVTGASTGASIGGSVGGGYGAAIGAGVGALGGALGLFGGGDDPMAEALANKRRQLEALGTPPDLSYELALEEFRSSGQLTPQQEEVYRQQYSNVGGIQEDTTGRDTQIQALNLLKERGMGLGAEERAAFSEMRDMTQRDAQAKQQQIMNQMAARGQGGSGSELLAALQGAQASNTRLSQEGDRLGSVAAQNALSAISQSGQLGGQIRNSDYNAQANKAKALDAMDEFNLRNSMSVQERNIAALNRAEATNLHNTQSIANANVNMANREVERQANAKRNFYNDQVNAINGTTNIGIAAAQNKASQPSDWQTLGKVANTLGQAYSKSNDGATIGGDAWKSLSNSFNSDEEEQSVGNYNRTGPNLTA